jgi:trans-aconitate methyltransferase
VVGIDYTPAAIERTPALLSAQGLAVEVVQADVLTHQPDKQFDAIYEQTCLRALHPDHWVDYVRQGGAGKNLDWFMP